MGNYKMILEDMKFTIMSLDGYKKDILFNEYIDLVIKVTGINNFYNAIDYLTDKKGFYL